MIKWNIISHNNRGLNYRDNIAKEKKIIKTLTPTNDMIMIQEHKLRGTTLEYVSTRLMHVCTSWILEAAPGERSWLNPNGTGKGGVKIPIPH